LILAADSSLFSNKAAKAALIWIFINEKQYDSAIGLSESFLVDHPQSRTFLWPAGESSFLSENYDAAYLYYSRIFDGLKDQPGNYYNVIEAAYWMSKCKDAVVIKSGFYEHENYIKSILDQIPRKIFKKQKKKIEYMINEKKSD